MCHYRHALPPGFVLNKDKKKLDKKDEVSIEDLVEKERAKLGSVLTKITLESFLAWKKKKISEKKEKSRKEDERKKAEFKAGRHIGLSGRDMFTFNPDLVEEDMEEGEGAFNFVREDEGDDGTTRITEITMEMLALQAREADGSGTQVSDRQFQVPSSSTLENGAVGGSQPNNIEVPIDENLFDEDEEDLDELEEELIALNVD